MMVGWLFAVDLTPSSMYSWYLVQTAVWPLIWAKPTWVSEQEPRE